MASAKGPFSLGPGMVKVLRHRIYHKYMHLDRNTNFLVLPQDLFFFWNNPKESQYFGYFRCIDTPSCLTTIFTKKTTFVIYCFLRCTKKIFPQNWASIKRKEPESAVFIYLVYSWLLKDLTIQNLLFFCLKAQLPSFIR